MGVLNMEFTFSDNTVGVLDVPKQKAYNLYVEIENIDNAVKITVPSLNASFEGTLKDKTLKGNWIQNRSYPLILNRISDIPSDFKFPEMQKIEEKKYSSSDIYFPSLDGSFNLAGTITIPKEGKSFNAFILVSGSGSQDRNEEILGIKPFKILAEELTKAGYIVLRYDDRGFAESGGNAELATSIDLANDVLAAVNYLKQQSNIKSIGIIGHSEGSLLGLIASSKSDDITSLISLAGPGINGKEILVSQTKTILKNSGADDEYIQRIIDINSRCYSIILDENLTDKQKESQLSEIMKQLGLDKKNITIYKLDGLNHLFQKANTGSVNEYSISGIPMTGKTIPTILKWLEDINGKSNN